MDTKVNKTIKNLNQIEKKVIFQEDKDIGDVIKNNKNKFINRFLHEHNFLKLILAFLIMVMAGVPFIIFSKISHSVIPPLILYFYVSLPLGIVLFEKLSKSTSFSWTYKKRRQRTIYQFVSSYDLTLTELRNNFRDAIQQLKEESGYLKCCLKVLSFSTVFMTGNILTNWFTFDIFMINLLLLFILLVVSVIYLFKYSSPIIRMQRLENEIDTILRYSGKSK